MNFKAILRFLLRCLYQLEVNGLEHYHSAGKRVLIIANHSALLDGVLLYAILPETPTFAISPEIAKKKIFKPFLAFVRLFELDPMNPLAVKAMVRYLQQDKKAVIFPEGRITVTGTLMKVYDGPALIADKSAAAILPIAIEGAQYSRLSYMKGKGPVCWFPKIRITILPPEQLSLSQQLNGHLRRKAAARQLNALMYKLAYRGFNHRKTLYSALLASAARNKHAYVLEDLSRQQLRYKDLILRSILLSSVIKKQTQAAERVGILMPNVNALAVLFFALQAINRVPAMLNFTAGAKALQQACKIATVSTVYTSRAFIDNAKLTELAARLAETTQLIFLEDLLPRLGLYAKLCAWYRSINPARHYQPSAPDAAALVLFTSGSEGQPRGVVLSHSNVLANYAQVRAYVGFNTTDIVFSCLPLFHSFGLNAGFLMPLYSGSRVFLYPTPLHYRIIPERIYQLGATILFGTNTFFKGYARYAHQYDFNSLRYLIAGAEKLQVATVRLYMERFGKLILQGYGVTETSPVIAVNTPLFNQLGSVGKILPGMHFYMAPVDGINNGGRLVVKGANVMLGYLLADKPGEFSPPKTDRGERWYDTGDIVAVDDFGYITILGRAKRFAKLAGEMVSLTVVEELATLAWPHYNHAAIAVEDPHKGEQIILFTEYQAAARKALQQVITEQQRSTLLLPKTIKTIGKIPVLGTGKTDYIALAKQLG